jgi:hypothetical protein
MMLTAEEVRRTGEQLENEYPEESDDDLDQPLEKLAADLGQDFFFLKTGFLTVPWATPMNSDDPRSETLSHIAMAAFMLGFYLGKTEQHDEFSLN